MEARELRIGNWVNFWKRDYHGQVTGVLNGGAYIDNGKEISGCLSLFQFKPIALTEEWLEKVKGISKTDKGWAIEVYDIAYHFQYKDWDDTYHAYIEYTDSPFPEDNDKLYPFGKGIKYVHQLQNLYFALTNDELSLEP